MRSKPLITYFAFFAKSGLYKIGASINPHRRLRVLTGKYRHHGKHELIGAIHSSKLSEKAAHEMFQAFHVKGDWFRFTPYARKKMRSLIAKDWQRIVPNYSGYWFSKSDVASMRQLFPGKSAHDSMERMVDAILAGKLEKSPSPSPSPVSA